MDSIFPQLLQVWGSLQQLLQLQQQQQQQQQQRRQANAAAAGDGAAGADASVHTLDDGVGGVGFILWLGTACCTLLLHQQQQHVPAAAAAAADRRTAAAAKTKQQAVQLLGILGGLHPHQGSSSISKQPSGFVT
jgi:hypothetical protein